MAKLLYLVHRLPYPPNKGDKVRSYHLLKHLAARHEVHLGTFVDDPDDLQHLGRVRELCTSLQAVRLHPGRAKLASLRGLLSGEALSLPYYRDAALARWVDETVQREAPDAVVVFSSTMAQYAPASLPLVLDFVDLDSAKWSEYAGSRRWPLSWLYRREGRCLLDFEARMVERALCSFFVTDKEVALFRSQAPAARGRVEALGNGVDAEFFAPAVQRDSPFAAGERALVFTGAMDYWPNEDAVAWFAAEVLPRLRSRHPGLRFYIVGRSPTPAVTALAGPDVVVTGTVDDVRPYLQHAAVVVAPLRLARGIQNKILEAMAMARPVVAAQGCVEAIDARAGEDLLGATDAEAYVAAIGALLEAPARAAEIGRAGRRCVLNGYSWAARLAGIDRYLAELPPRPGFPPAHPALQTEAA
ncbi:TIGR03087 family PEP-CTERM/XrtA system glycosyltransferase [Roseateles sp. DAIF2]|uniref:TIGR03087 family PEP-CTERM/XrtA system glycosyltransferase n=1 Tax=Roseateles sp. DAIF2 TaxID=2714952 RepID=UPI0018A28526|nr:TIGR03087 family PEP-CTERM/XrtA system glycosyltransferase [Roseateles sp. DAIF2]QPF73692.1 TIGR03087 family PEP-CTERM/XrtA system glycosyltransferase [Roseateles sp. DAIF2]